MPSPERPRLGLLNSAVAAYYYLRVLVVMYMKDAPDDAPVVPPPWRLMTALWSSALGTILLGVFPSIRSSITPASPPR